MDPEIIKKCGAAGYAADCSVLPTKSGSGTASGSSVTSGGSCSCCTGSSSGGGFCTDSYQGTASSKAACTKYPACSTCDGSGGSGSCTYSSGGRRLSFSSFSSLTDLSQTKKLLESAGQGLVAHATNAHKRELKAFARLLESHVTTYDNSCATANDMICDDPAMKDYST